MSGPDHKASMSINNFAKLVSKIREVEKALGKDKKIISKNELQVSKALRKVVFLKEILKKAKF